MEVLKVVFMIVWTIWVYSKRLVAYLWLRLNDLWARTTLIRWAIVLATLSYFGAVHGGPYLARIPPLPSHALWALFGSGFFCFGAAAFIYVLFCWFRATMLMPPQNWPMAPMAPVPIHEPVNPRSVGEEAELNVSEKARRRAAAIAAAMSGVDVAGRFSPYDEERQADIEALHRMRQRGVIDDELGAEILAKVAVSVSE